ncbi:DinB family protein [Pseudalkalibacillus salsuginis]|uniref:DinB family protein n=1 Tax=Pseudalkalibacillus salsuginis TaxID=2910972 RepID=UPI001F2BAF09|nr:DinB family protein [Pseudalkalibacillus salsuginis]MCF6409364.1 DinB family protein [Pseudalkalibacillus salsuginis]
MDKSPQWLLTFEEKCEWVSSLRTTPDERWLKPIAEGKWSIGEIISHFYFWDRFIFNERLLKLESDDFKKANVEDMNKNASDFAKSGVRREELISMFIQSRKEICLFIHSLPDQRYHVPLKIGNNSVTIEKYIERMNEHDHHHINQVEAFLKDKALVQE